MDSNAEEIVEGDDIELEEDFDAGLDKGKENISVFENYNDSETVQSFDEYEDYQYDSKSVIEKENENESENENDDDGVVIYKERMIKESSEPTEVILGFPVVFKIRHKKFLCFKSFAPSGEIDPSIGELPVLFDNSNDVIEDKMENFFPLLRGALNTKGFPFEITHEIVLNFECLNLELAEDNIYANEVSFSDIASLVTQLNKNSSTKMPILEVSVSSKKRFSGRFNELLLLINANKGFDELFSLKNSDEIVEVFNEDTETRLSNTRESSSAPQEVANAVLKDTAGAEQQTSKTRFDSTETGAPETGKEPSQEIEVDSEETEGTEEVAAVEAEAEDSPEESAEQNEIQTGESTGSKLDLELELENGKRKLELSVSPEPKKIKGN